MKRLELGKMGHQGVVSSMAKRTKKETGVKTTSKEAASKMGKMGGSKGGNASTRTSPGKKSGAHKLDKGYTMSMSKHHTCRGDHITWTMGTKQRL